LADQAAKVRRILRFSKPVSMLTPPACCITSRYFSGYRTFMA
jgi:hypothetical protein